MVGRHDHDGSVTKNAHSERQVNLSLPAVYVLLASQRVSGAYTGLNQGAVQVEVMRHHRSTDDPDNH